ncbi:MAG: Hpt domain-containing protein [Bacilli bacterium]
MRDISILKSNGFDIDSVFETFGEIEVYEEILTDFYNQAKERGLKIIECIKNGDLKNYAIIVHSIKGECLYLGINKLADMSYEQQLKAEENDMQFIKTHFNEYIEEFTRILNTIKKYYGK